MFAIESLAPNSDYVIFGDEYSGIEWRDKVNTKPTEEQVTAKIAEIKAAEPMSQLRDERNRRLAECDWIVTKNANRWNRIAVKTSDAPLISLPIGGDFQDQQQLAGFHRFACRQNEF